jgi:single stranded DNA-binding protein
MKNVQFKLFIGKEPETNQYGEKTVCRTSAAFSTPKRDKDGNWMKESPTFWYNVEAWDKKAAFLQAATKGSMVWIDGEQKVDEWQDKDGNKRQGLTIVVKEMIIYPKNQPTDNSRQQAPEHQENFPAFTTPQGEPDLPF